MTTIDRSFQSFLLTTKTDYTSNDLPTNSGSRGLKRCRPPVVEEQSRIDRAKKTKITTASPSFSRKRERTFTQIEPTRTPKKATLAASKPDLFAAYHKRIENICLMLLGTEEAMQVNGVEPYRLDKLKFLVKDIIWVQQQGYMQADKLKNILQNLLVPLCQKEPQIAVAIGGDVGFLSQVASRV